MPQDEPDEHLRFAGYLYALEHVADADELALVRQVLTDAHQGMAQSAVLRHVDRRAAALLDDGDDGFPTWARSMGAVVTAYPLLTRRLEEWTLFRALTIGLAWRPEALLGATNWLQLKAAEGANAEAVSLLAGRGRTKRIRGTARSNTAKASARVRTTRAEAGSAGHRVSAQGAGRTGTGEGRVTRSPGNRSGDVADGAAVHPQGSAVRRGGQG